MSNFRGGAGPELFYSERIDGTALNTFTTEASLMGAYPIPQIPATYFDKTGLESSSMKIRAWFNVSDTTAAPTFTLAVRLNTSATAYSAAALGWTATALTVQGTSQTNLWAQLDCDITLKTIAAGGATSTISAMGLVSGPAFTAQGSMPATNVTSDASTFDATGATLYYLWLGSACGTNNAANAISLKMLKVYLEN